VDSGLTKDRFKAQISKVQEVTDDSATCMLSCPNTRAPSAFTSRRVDHACTWGLGPCVHVHASSGLSTYALRYGQPLQSLLALSCCRGRQCTEHRFHVIISPVDRWFINHVHTYIVNLVKSFILPEPMPCC
jgi:hypothetical protein